MQVLFLYACILVDFALSSLPVALTCGFTTLNSRFAMVILRTSLLRTNKRFTSRPILWSTL
ncbi:Uncharacterized protein TCM_045132 [Theobroma cacao]|uniref:Uncharacterized protein n=1 Tax=Theobroma cacao TaxID=3641 RepID=A0A061FSC3_THECC|nr:Uncharacterized protein TCM_045132 [Theobroma cacao]